MHQRAVFAVFLAVAVAAVALGTNRQRTDTGDVAAERAAVPVAAAADPEVVRRATEAVRTGLEHARASRAEPAISAYAQAAELLPEFSAWAALLSAQAAARTGDTAAVRRHLARSDTALVREWGWRSQVDAALESGDTASAVQLAEAAAPEIRDAARRAGAWTRAGTLHATAGRTTAAVAALRRAIDSSTGAGASVEAARTLADIGTPTAADQLRIGRVYLRHGNFDRAAEAIVAYVDAGGVSVAQRADLQLALGRGMFNARDYAGAERRLRRAVTIAGTNADARKTAAEAMFLLGRAQYRRGNADDARATFLRVTRTFAGTAAAARSHFTIADIDHDADRLESARTHYRAAIEAGGPDVTLAAMRLGGIALVAGEPRRAALVYASAHGRAKTDTDVQKTGFWWAHALSRAGARDSARLVLAKVQKVDPFSYYGLRAGELLELDPWELARSSPPAAEAAVRERVERRVDVVAVLRGADLVETSEFEASRVFSRYSGSDGALYALGAAYHDHELAGHGIRVGRELLRREGSWNRRILQLLYPFPYGDSITAAARANNLDPYLVAGLIRQESMFNPRARSGAGAIGLMQVMPETGARLAPSAGLRGFHASQLTDPAVNLRLGTRYLADQISRYNGRLVDAIAAYNAGPNPVARWSEFPEHADAELFAERIPYEETRDYVRIVRQNARIYRELYGDSTGR
jgi:soluble lytic murein transglycosylase